MNDLPDITLGQLEHGDFVRLAAFIQDYAGIKMSPMKKTLVEGRLRRRVRALGMTSLPEYCRYLFDHGGLEEEAVHVIDVVTTNKTDFFREPQHFTFLMDQVLPRLAAERTGPRQEIKGWSAASSTGAEPYTIAMMLAQFAERQGGTRFSVFATDICTEVLHTAARAVYKEEDVAPVPKELLKRYILRSRDPSRHEVRIAPELRQNVHFRRLNLMDETYSMARDMDFIFCRNVLIYFDKETQRRVVERLCQHLRPGGFLFLGHSEALTGHGLPLTPVANAVFLYGEG